MCLFVYNKNQIIILLDFTLILVNQFYFFLVYHSKHSYKFDYHPFFLIDVEISKIITKKKKKKESYVGRNKKNNKNSQIKKSPQELTLQKRSILKKTG